jgi:phospholipid/cholesterol/gamma-HCH transport system substrate-binding protein
MTPLKEKKPRAPRNKPAGLALLAVSVLVLAVVYLQFRGDLTAKTTLTMLSSRAGLVMNPGSKVTFNGVQIGRVDAISEIAQDGQPAAKFTLDIYRKYIELIPANADVDIEATTVFGTKYVSLISPKNPSPQHITSHDVIDARSVTTEFNTLSATLTSITDKVDPVKLNLTLSATAEALTGLGRKFGESIVNGNAILDDVNPRMPQLRHDIARLADLGDTYANAAPDLFAALNNAVTTARTLTAQQKDLDAALLAAVGFSNTGADIFERAAPYLVRGATDLAPTAKLLDTYSPELFCTIRDFHDTAPIAAAAQGGKNGYAFVATDRLLTLAGLIGNLATGIPLLATGVGGLAGLVGGAPNPYVYPDNLPRTNAHGGPGGAPGCWQPTTHDFWPAPYLVMDTGNNIAPYNHLEVASPYAVEYVWGRQVGENTINP